MMARVSRAQNAGQLDGGRGRGTGAPRAGAPHVLKGAPPGRAYPRSHRSHAQTPLRLDAEPRLAALAPAPGRAYPRSHRSHAQTPLRLDAEPRLAAVGPVRARCRVLRRKLLLPGPARR